MATINHSSGADIIVPNNNGTTYRGLGGDDTYILSNSIAANAAITIVDTSGANKIQLVNGLSVASTKFAADAVQLTLSNGAVVTINGASNFDFDLGGNATAGTSGSVSDFAGFAAGAGVSSLPSSGSVAGASNVSVQGTAWSGGTGGSYTVTKTSSSVDEGSSVTFTITASSAVSADTTFSWTVIGDSNGSTVDKAGTSDIDVLSGSATIASGASSTTFTVTASSDSIVEGIEGIKVSVFDSSSNALSSDVILVNNSGSAATSQSFTLTTGVNEDIGGSGNDTFDASTNANSLNDFDNLDGADGTDTVVAKTTSTNGGSVAPVLKNIEAISITNTDSDANDGDVFTVNLAEATSINTLMNVTSNDAVTFDNVGQVSTLEVKSAQNDTTVNYDKAALAGTADNMTIVVKGTNGTDISIDDDNTLNSSILETVTIDSQSVANTIDSLDLSNVNTGALVVTGDKKLTISSALDATVASVDASGSTGGLTLSTAPNFANITVTGSSAADAITVSTGNVNISGGAGNDTLTATTTWNGNDVFDGGDGRDTLVLTASFEPLNTGPASANTIAAGLSNVETISLSGANTVISLDKDMGALDTLSITDTTKQTINLNDGYVGDTNIFIGTATSASNRDAVEQIVNTASVDLSIYAKVGDIDGSTNSKTTITGGFGQDTLYLYNVVSGDTTAVLAGTADSISRVDKIVILDGTAGNDVTITTGDYALTSAAGAVLPLTIDGTAMGATEVLTVNGTSATAKLNIIGGDAADDFTGGNAADTISGGAGNDVIDANAGAGNVIDGGAGNDSITLGDGVDNISGGAGNDTITAEAPGTQLKLNDTIDGGDGTDTLTITGGNITSATVFAGVSNIEKIKPTDGSDITASGSLGGATTFDLSANEKNELTLTAGKWSADTTVTFGSAADTGNNDDVVTNSANVTLTVNSRDDDIESVTTLTGGTGTDTLNLTATGGTATLANVTNFEQVNVVDATVAGTDITIVPNLTTTKVQNISATELDGSTQNDEQLTLSGATAAGKLNVTGGGGNDALTGGTANDTLIGGSGQDAINGNGGADHLEGGAANDTFTIDTKAEYTSAVGSDTIDGGAGTDTVAFGAAMNMAASQLGSISNTEKWTITAGSDFTISDAVLENNPGLAFVYAGNGTLSGGEDTAGAALMTSAINFTGTAAGDMKLIGSSADDSFTFNATATLTTADTIDGNAGSDTIFLNNNTSSTDGTGNALTGGSQVTWDSDVKGIEKVVINDLAADYAGDVDIAISDGYTDASLTIDGSSLDVNSTDESDGEYLKVVSSDTNTALTVLGGAARDTITGGGAADSIVGNGAYDSLTGGAGNDTIEGGAGADTILGGAGTDNISGGDGNDAINVTTFTDFKTSGGVETVDGGAGTDSLNFAANAVLTLTAPELSKLTSIESITIATQANAATLTFGNETFDNLGASSLSLVSNTGSGVTTIDGSAVSNGSFLIINDIGADTADKYVGGSGDDIFRFDGTAGLKANDTVTGNGGNDTIQLDASAGAVTAVFDFDTATVEKVVVYAGATGVEGGVVTLNLDEHSVAAKNAYTAALTIDMSGAVNTGLAGVKVNYTDDGDSTVEVNGQDDGDTAIKAALTILGSVKGDVLIGSAGNDTITGNSTLLADSINGGAGNDTISTGAGADLINGGTGNDNITSGGGKDTISGGTGNDVISAGDGADRIDAESGLDNITTGLGNDTVVYDAAADSSGSLKDIITDFTQSTINATTGETTAGGDNIEINFGTIGNSVDTWTLSDKGDVENGGLAAAAIDGVMGSFVFADDTSTIYLDYNGDGFLNTSDLQITVSGLTSFHSNDINAIVTAGTGGDTLTGGAGDDSITGGSGADSLYGGFGNDTIEGAAGGDKIYGQGGNDTLSNTGATDSTLDGGAGDDTLIGSATDQTVLTGGTGDDTFDMKLTTVQANRDTITDFEDAGAVVGDVIILEQDSTSDGTADGSVPVFAQATVAAGNNAPVAIVDTPNSDAFDVLEITIDSGTSTLATDFADGGTGAELLKNLGALNNETATGITVTGDHSFFIIAYDAGNAYIYFADNGAADTLMEPAAIKPLVTVTGVTAGAFVPEDFLLG